MRARDAGLWLLEGGGGSTAASGLGAGRDCARRFGMHPGCDLSRARLDPVPAGRFRNCGGGTNGACLPCFVSARNYSPRTKGELAMGFGILGIVAFLCLGCGFAISTRIAKTPAGIILLGFLFSGVCLIALCGLAFVGCIVVLSSGSH